MLLSKVYSSLGFQLASARQDSPGTQGGLAFVAASTRLRILHVPVAGAVFGVPGTATPWDRACPLFTGEYAIWSVWLLCIGQIDHYWEKRRQVQS